MATTRFKVPGGLPVLFRLPNTDDSRKGQWPRLQRESYAFYPGERANQSFKREFFDSLCGTCHNSLSGSPLDASSRPDILTQASVTHPIGRLALIVLPDLTVTIAMTYLKVVCIVFD